MDTTPISEKWETYFGWMELTRLVGIDPDMPIRTYIDAGLSGDEPVTSIDHTGLVNFQWEEEDELHLNGKVLWRTESERFYVSALALVDGKVKHYAVSNDGTVIGAYNNDVGYTDSDEPKCKQCPDHGMVIFSEVGQNYDKWS